MDRIYIRWSEKTATGLARQPRLLRSLEEKRLNYKKYLNFFFIIIIFIYLF